MSQSNLKINNFGGIIICGIIGFLNLKLIKLIIGLLNGLHRNYDMIIVYISIYSYLLC